MIIEQDNQEAQDPLAKYESYLDAAPVGIDAWYAWRRGGNGKGVGLIDIEQSMVDDPPDVFGNNITATMGVIAATDKSIGRVGIAPGARVRVVSPYERDPYSPTGVTRRTGAAIIRAARSMERGDVLLIAVQLERYKDPSDGCEYMVPVEAQRAEYAAICLAVSMYGVIVVEAAGDGNVNLDRITDSKGRRMFSRAIQDSGAILVGAARSKVPHSRLSPSNYGSRVDCYAWGENIVTSGGGETPPGHAMNVQCTKGAAAIVAGAAVAIQSAAQRALGHRLTPSQMRFLLSAPENGTASVAGAGIGVMPDLRKIVDRLLYRAKVA